MLKVIKKPSSLMLSIIIVLSLTTLLLIFAKSASRNPQASNLHAPIIVKQLAKENGVTPVELSCGEAQLTNPKEITGFSCVLKNNTEKSIEAVSTMYSIITEKDGKEAGTPNYLTIESMVHPDLMQEHLHQAIAPGGEQALDVSNTTVYDDAVIKRVEVQVDYVEFSDMSSLGPNQKGSQIINSIRGGAAKYKNWLVQQFHKGGNLTGSVIPLLQSDKPLPTDIGLDDNYLKQGAKIYRSHLLMIVNSQGPNELERILNKTNESFQKDE